MDNEDPDISVVIRTVVQLGFLFDPNSFFSVADRQLLIAHRHFKEVMHALAKASMQIPAAAAPVLLHAMACLAYRCSPILPVLLDAMEQNLKHWSVEALSLSLYSVASLGLGGDGGLQFDLLAGVSRDYSHICAMLVDELAIRASLDDTLHVESPLHTWSRAAFATAMLGLYDAKGSNGYVLPLFVKYACDTLENQKEALDGSGWAQFFLYQVLYCADVEQPVSEAEIKGAMPMWIQERLHMRWLDSIVLQAQPQGADTLQQDIDKALKRTRTQSLLNCSVGRDWDEQHCWFAGFLLNPRTALECDSMLPLGLGRPRPSGWLQMKARVLRKMQHSVVTIHKCFWDQLSEDQKDEQIFRLRAQVGYRHDEEQEARERPIRQRPHTYAGLEYKKRDWFPSSSPDA